MTQLGATPRNQELDDLIAMVKIAEISTSGSPLLIDVQSIPQTFKHLRLVGTLRADGSVGANLRMTFNGVVTNTYDTRVHDSTSLATGASGEGIATTQFSSQAYAALGSLSDESAAIPPDDYQGIVIDILNYRSTTQNKAYSYRGVRHTALTSGAFVDAAGIWRGLAAITAIQLFGFATVSPTALDAGSSVSVYGLR